MTDIQYRSVALDDLEVRKDEGTFAGYANRHDVVDSYGTQFRAGAWDAGTPDLAQPTALLWMHNNEHPVGVFTAKDTPEGLWIEGRYDDSPEGMTARARALSGSAPELSVGFVPLTVDAEDDTVYTAARLVEVSQITRRFASQPGAALASVRKKQDTRLQIAAARLRLL